MRLRPLLDNRIEQAYQTHNRAHRAHHPKRLPVNRLGKADFQSLCIHAHLLDLLEKPAFDFLDFFANNFDFLSLGSGPVLCLVPI